ncbi:hypothetical protein COBT_001568 [Conglomerata obtusa]
MFVSINDKQKVQIIKMIKIEKESLFKIYQYGLICKKYNVLDDYKLLYSENQEILNSIKERLVYNSLKEKSYTQIKKMLSDKFILSSQLLCHKILERMLNEKDFLKAKKMIKYCKKKEFYNVKFNELIKRYINERKYKPQR